jgi:signal transduction histidine kinase
MSTRVSDTLSGAQSDMIRVHRRVVHVGATAAWFAAALLLIAGFISGDQQVLVGAVGPTIAAAFMTAQIVLHRENGSIALVGSAVVVMVMYTVVGTPDTLLPAALALVVISAIGMLLVAKHLIPLAAGVAVFLGIAPQFWGLSLVEAVQLGSVMALSFVMTTVIFQTVRNAATALDTKFKVMFDQSPTAMFEEDWTEAIEYVRSEYSGPPERISRFLSAYPEVVRRAVGKATITRVNDAAISLLEASGPEDLLGSRDPGKVTEENIESFVDALVALYLDREFFEREFLAHTLRGRKIWLQARCVKSTTGEKPGSLLVALADVTHARAKTEALADLIRAKDLFIASVSHELRTPLTAVVGFTSEMAGSSISGDEMAELMKLVSGQAEEMSYIVDDLLVAARAEIGTVSLDVGEVDLGEQLHAVIGGVGVKVGEIPPRLPSVSADATRVRQILRNLLTNLNRYGGPERRILGGENGDRAWIEVRDNGEGVSAEDADRIFEPYATAHARVTGSVGLGLAVARQLAELMGGSLRYRRDKGESVFRLELPLSRKPIAA